MASDEDEARIREALEYWDGEIREDPTLGDRFVVVEEAGPMYLGPKAYAGILARTKPAGAFVDDVISHYRTLPTRPLTEDDLRVALEKIRSDFGQPDHFLVPIEAHKEMLFRERCPRQAAIVDGIYAFVVWACTDAGWPQCRITWDADADADVYAYDDEEWEAWSDEYTREARDRRWWMRRYEANLYEVGSGIPPGEANYVRVVVFADSIESARKLALEGRPGLALADAPGRPAVWEAEKDAR